MNHIENIRAELQQLYKTHDWKLSEQNEYTSPSGKYRLSAAEMWTESISYEITQVCIYDTDSGDLLFDFLVNDGRFFHAWLQKDGTEYMVCAEDIYGGQTLIDLSGRQMAGYSPGMDGFIWTDFQLSPDGKILAVIGCYWACPYLLKLYDFSAPLQLPLPELAELELIGNDEVMNGWADKDHLRMKGTAREYRMTADKDGFYRNELVKETPSERNLNLAGYKKELAGNYGDNPDFQQRCRSIMARLEYAGTEFLSEELRKLSEDLVFVFDTSAQLSVTDRVLFVELKNELTRAIMTHKTFRSALCNAYYDLANTTHNVRLEVML
ncbi:MAG: hypothetical protein IBJ09_01560 [Bacteroidia bacterium]|nr:hypothetical protein [Bacteroidia bacterium]